MRRLIIVCIIAVLISACGDGGLLSGDVPTLDVGVSVKRTLTALAPTATMVIPTEKPTVTPANNASCVPPNTPVDLGLVTQVIDGDTIEAIINGQTQRVRYIGIDTPEVGRSGTPSEYFAKEATDQNYWLVINQPIYLIKDVSETDQYGRLLRYVFVGNLNGTFVNYRLVRQGFATAVTFPPDVACAETFREAERLAREQNFGMWLGLPTP